MDAPRTKTIANDRQTSEHDPPSSLSDFFICLRLCPGVATRFGPGIVPSPASRRIVARIGPDSGNLVLLRNADRKRTRRCVPSAVLIWSTDRNHAKIIAQRHPSCASRWPLRVKEGQTRRTRHRESRTYRGAKVEKRREEASEQPDPGISY